MGFINLFNIILEYMSGHTFHEDIEEEYLYGGTIIDPPPSLSSLVISPPVISPPVISPNIDSTNTIPEHIKNYIDHRGSTLSDTEILDELNHNIVITPFIRSNLGPNSYDITLGPYYFSHTKSSLTFFNPESAKHSMRYWDVNLEDKLNYGAKHAELITDQETADNLDVNIGDEVIIIESGETILAHTKEFIGGRNLITSSLHTRSTLARSCVSTHHTAGFGDVGFISRYTMEITNHGDDLIVLRVGSRVGQIGFHRTGPVSISYEKRGNYQSSDDIEQLTSTWHPIMMLPSSARKYIESLTK